MDRQAGSGLIEFLVALGILTVCLLAAASFIGTSMQGTKHNANKDFAIQKAISILEELKGIFESKTGNDATLLDGYDDGTSTETVLTIQSGVTDPAHPASGNSHNGRRWRFERQISVSKFPSVQSNDVRLVSVRIYGWEENRKIVLAEVSSVIRTIADSYPPTQVYDVYCLAIENVPGWWVYMANLIPFVENAIADLQARNPGLEFRTHWIRKLAYGRDPYYRPYLNELTDSEQDIDSVYFYPGRMPSGSAVNFYYVPSSMAAEVDIDGTVTNGYDASTNPNPYTLADMYNHAMRFEDEKALFEARVAAGLESPDEPTWRLLIEDMYSNPEEYENAIVINVHGELFPFPPVRNFSDAAKDPGSRPGVRVVTHPENLRYDNSSEVKLRVYSYLRDPGDATAPDYLDEPISIVVRDVFSAGISVESIEGGLDLDPADGNADSYASESFDTMEDYTGDMHYTVSSTTDGTLIELHNSPLRSPCVGSSCADGGLAADKRLYGMEYIPTPMKTSSTSGDFSRNLVDGADRTKNTTRWVITIPEADLPDDAVLTIETRIGTDLTTGVRHPTENEAYNLSRTYAYIGDDTWIFGDGTAANPPHLPVTERFQVMGDPRHLPYADVGTAHDATTNPLGNGYNRYFDDVDSGSDYWPGLSDAENGWGDGDIEAEMNRCFEMLRDALLHSHAVYTTMTGFSYYYIGFGNEIGYDADNGFPNSIPVSTKPFTGSSGSMYEDTIRGSVRYIRSNESGNDWWAVHWLGELFPDAEYASQWQPNGNLETGVGSGTFVRDERQDITANLPAGTTLHRANRRTKEEGSTAFFSIGTDTSKFHHQYKDGQSGDIVEDGVDIANTYNFPVPNRVRISRPFNVNLNGSGGIPDEYQDPIYYEGVLSGRIINRFFDHDASGVEGSSLILLHGDQADDHTFVVVNGIDRTIYTGSAFMGRWAFLSLIQSFLAAGLQTDPDRVTQLPRIEVTAPNDLTDLDDPSSVTVSWNTEWERWDGRKYTSSYSDSFSESAGLAFAVLYSDDNGKTWKHCQDDSLATPGTRPTDSSHLETGSSLSWSTPSSNFPKGTYLVRVEAYTNSRALHYSYHQRRIFIRR
jgi:hypothetical protein